jgi:uncharacterized protein (DUF1015 family)
MAEVRPFRALRYDPALADALRTIAPPYDVISPAQQAALYERDPHNIVRIEYAREQPDDNEASNRYTRAAGDLRNWRANGVLALDTEPSIYVYRQRFEWGGRNYERTAYFGAVRLEEWDRGIIKPHEHTLSNPKADRMNLLRATRAQVSPVYSLYRPRSGRMLQLSGETILQAEADDQTHRVERVTDGVAIAGFARLIGASDVYIADGHHRYETALAYRDEARARFDSWSGEEPENFVLMALTQYDDPGLLVLPTHRLVHMSPLADTLAHITECFDVHALSGSDASDPTSALSEAGQRAPAFVAVGLDGGSWLITLRDRAAVESAMPPDQSEAWKRLDVNVLQYGILQTAFGIDDASLIAGGAVSYTQDTREAVDAVRRGAAHLAFLLNATPVPQVLAVADAGGRMPQKSTYFHPKLPTGLVLRPLD